METMTNKNIEEKLFNYFRYLRILEDKRVNDVDLAKTQRNEGTNLSFGDKFKNFSNSIKRSFNNYEGLENTINNNLNDIQKTEIISESEAHEYFNEYLKDDKNGLIKIILASSIILDNKYTYKHFNMGLNVVSREFFGNEYYLQNIKTRLEKNYKEIYPTSLTTAQKTLLVGTAAASLAALVFMPIALVGGIGASAATTTGALAAIGFADMQVGAAIITAEAVAVSAVMIGAIYGSIKLYNNYKVKKSIRNLTPEENAYYLAIQCTYLEEIKNTVSDEELNNQLDEILKLTNAFKSDNDFYLMIAKEDTENSTKKMRVFHNFDDRLVKILGI